MWIFIRSNIRILPLASSPCDVILNSLTALLQASEIILSNNMVTWSNSFVPHETEKHIRRQLVTDMNCTHNKDLLNVLKPEVTPWYLHKVVPLFKIVLFILSSSSEQNK